MAENPEGGKKLLEDKLFKNALIWVLGLTKDQVRAANDRKGLLYNPGWANRPLGCVIRKKSGKFEHGRPQPGVLDGFEFEGDGFIGGNRMIKNATAIVVAMPLWATKQTILSRADDFKNLSSKVEAPVFVDETFNRQETGIFLFEGENEFVEIDLTSK